MTTYREQGLAAKAARLGITDQRPVGTRSKRDRPFIVECLWCPSGPLNLPPKSRGWRKWGAYRTEAEALQVVERQARKSPFYEFRLRPQPPKP